MPTVVGITVAACYIFSPKETWVEHLGCPLMPTLTGITCDGRLGLKTTGFLGRALADFHLEICVWSSSLNISLWCPAIWKCVHKQSSKYTAKLMLVSPLLRMESSPWQRGHHIYGCVPHPDAFNFVLQILAMILGIFFTIFVLPR